MGLELAFFWCWLVHVLLALRGHVHSPYARVLASASPFAASCCLALLVAAGLLTLLQTSAQPACLLDTAADTMSGICVW